METPLKLTALFLVLTLHMIAQTDHKSFVETSNARRSLLIAEDEIRAGDLIAAEKQLEHTIKLKKNFAVAYRELGKVYYLLNKYEKSIEVFKTSFEIDSKLSRAAYFECGDAFFKMGKNDMAKYYYDKYDKMKGRRYLNKNKESALELEYDERLIERRANLAFSSKMGKPQKTATNIGQNINTKNDDYIPSITNDGKHLLFTRRMLDSKSEDIYISKKNKNGEWSESVKLGSSINSKKNEGMAKFATHGRHLYFAGCHREDTKGVCDIYKAYFKDGKVAKVESLEGDINSDSWDSQPAVSCDGKTLYFSSIRSSGFGGADIYVSHLSEDGLWSEPENLGNIINTKGDEEAPFIASDGKTLYFTSNGHPGQGQGDIYMSRWDGKQWSTPENLGPGFNSTGKELGLFIDVNSKSAYFSSSKYGGEGGLDIYEMELPPKFRPDATAQLEGYVIDAVSKKPVESLVMVGTDKKVRKIQTDKDGWFFLCVPGNNAYSFQIDKDGYEYFVEAIYLGKESLEKTTRFKIELQPAKVYQPTTVKTKMEVKREQFFFAFDSYELSHESRAKLDQMIATIQADDSWKIEVVGFADTKGTAAYNKKLSKKRAEAIVAYLGSNGIDTQNVIRTEGRGSTSEGLQAKGSDKFDRRVDVVLRR